jgi:hypothetical protein
LDTPAPKNNARHPPVQAQFLGENKHFYRQTAWPKALQILDLLQNLITLEPWKRIM